MAFVPDNGVLHQHFATGISMPEFQRPIPAWLKHPQQTPFDIAPDGTIIPRQPPGAPNTPARPQQMNSNDDYRKRLAAALMGK